MRSWLKKTARKLLRLGGGSFAVNMAARNPSLKNIRLARKVLNIQMTDDQLFDIALELKSDDGKKFLVFGLGYDSQLWNALNKKGITLFIEDSQEWMDIVSSKLNVQVKHYSYQTKLTDLAEDLKGDYSKLAKTVEGGPWDVVLVDAPQGWREDTPGRLESVVVGLSNLAEGGTLYVHDTHREGEAMICDTVLAGLTYLGEIKGSPAHLRKFLKS